MFNRMLIIGLFAVGISGGYALSAENAEKAEKTEKKANKKGRAGKVDFLDKEHAPHGKGWEKLFDGKDLSGWKARDPKADLSWKVTDGVLINTPAHEHGGVDLVTEKKFEDFETYYEYKVPKGSNSGFYLRGRYEIQIFDDNGAKPSMETNGAIYSLVAPSEDASKKSGEWQCVYATIEGKKVNVWLNGKKIINNFEVKHATGLALDDKVDQPGPILLQGNHGAVEFRHIYIKPMKH